MRKFLLAVIVVAACAISTDGTFGIRPAEAAVSPGALVQFEAIGQTAPGVTWSVVETGGGTINTSGIYAAPPCPTEGVFHVRAAKGTASAQATVTVAAVVKGVAVSPTDVTLEPGQTQQFTATVTTSCGAQIQTLKVTAPAVRR